MTSTDFKIGLTQNSRPSSRVLKPPGGGHSNIFAEPEVAVNAPRAKYNQQNSSNLNACMGSTDANIAVEKLRDEITFTKEEEALAANADKASPKETQSNGNSNGNQSRGRVPPGGYSSGGFW